jgi:glycosyltransferase involved in cell wall biosynthesis
MLITVVIPTYNRATLIAATLDSVVAQTGGHRIEVEIVDDGSTDNTAAVVEPYIDRHSDPAARVFMRYTQLNKQGVVTARNTAIAQSTGEVIAFLDSDDYWAPDKLSESLAPLNDPRVGVVHTSFRYVNEAGDITDDGPGRPENPCVGDCTATLLDEDLVIFSSVLMRRSVVDQIAAMEPHGKPFDPRWTNAQDYDLLLRASTVCRFAYVAKPLVYYRFHQNHGAMGNLPRAFGFHARVQLDFVERHGKRMGIDREAVRGKVASFLYGRAESMFWQRYFEVSSKLCDVARELGVADARFDDLQRKLARPRWLYTLKDKLDALRGKGGPKRRGGPVI